MPERISFPDKEEETLKWWEENEDIFPNLAAMVRQYLSCPTTSATVERLFSKVGLAFTLFTEKRQSGKAGTLADILFARENVE